MYNSLNEEVKEFMGKGIFDRNWVTVIQVGLREPNSSPSLIFYLLLPDQGQIFHFPDPILSRSR